MVFKMVIEGLLGGACGYLTASLYQNESKGALVALVVLIVVFVVMEAI
jgi:hypothetical protein